MGKKFRYIFLLALFFPLMMSAQQLKNITGVVTDSKTGEPLIGAAVMEKGTANGVTTNLNGEFSIRVKNEAVLNISFIGYLQQDVLIEKENRLMIRLVERTKELDEVVVIGYGIQKKSDVTGSISSISGDDINSVPVASSVMAIQGKASGVQVTQNTGAPGAKTTIKIRGTGTVNDSDPLYVVDGFIVDAIDHINPNDIANIEILKDAASSSIYGSRSANGVVLITTKKGSQGKLKINFDSYAGFSEPWKKIDVMGVEDFALMRDYVTGDNSYSAEGKLFYSKNSTTGELYYDTEKFHRLDSLKRNSPANWWDAITQTGIKQQYNISLSGGTDAHTYMVSGNYYQERGIVQTSDYQRFSTRVNLTNRLTKWLSLQTNLLYSNDNRDIVPEGSQGVLKRALNQSPLVFTYNSAGYYSENHPIAQIARNHNYSGNNRIDLNAELSAKITKNLSYQFKISEYVNFFSRKQFTEVQKREENFVMPTDLTGIYLNNSITNKWEINNLLSFNKNSKLHSVSAVIGHTMEGYRYNVQESWKKGTSGNSANYWYLSAGYIGDIALESPYEWTALGFLGRINYSYLDKYLVQANFRADASSKFSKSNRWGYFPSLSLGWKFSSESFLADVDWLTLGKLRVGWGQLGNNRIGEYARFTIVNNEYNYAYGAGNHVLYPGSTSTTLGNPDIKWEKTESFNVGLDFNFFDNRLSTTVEVFDKLTTDMLLRVPVVISAGLVQAPMINAGSVRNQGIEWTVNFRQNIKRFKFEAGFNVSYIRNEVISLGSGNEPVWGANLSDEASINDFVTKTIVGRPIGCFYGYLTDGIFNTVEEVQASGQNDGITEPGDFRFRDLNKDGRITADDRTYLGSPHPDFVFGIPLSASYGNFTLNLFFQGQTGNQIFNVMEYYLNSAHGTGNVYVDIRDKHWSGTYRSDRAFFPENLNASVPDLDAADRPKNFRASDFYVKDGSYLRLKNIQVNYSFPESTCRFLKVDNLTAYIGGYNLLTFTRYDGFDPEVGKNAGSEANNLYMGVDHGNYPQARTITLGLKIGL